MTVARKELITPETNYYHCIARCVRQSFLYGVDPLTKRDYSHRKQWVIQRLQRLTDAFCIDLCAYAIMSNHYHLVLRLAPERAAELSDEQVLSRWHSIYRGNPLIKRYLAAGPLEESDRQSLPALVASCRERLASISWFMRALNEPLAKLANREDGCTGRFWEGRFKSQAILDDVGLLACMAYVDLNPFRAGCVDTPEASVEISLHARLKEAASKHPPSESSAAGSAGAQSLPELLPFTDTLRERPLGPQHTVLPFSFHDYLGLIDWLAKQQRKPNTAVLPQDTPDILQRLGLEPMTFINALKPGRLSRGTAIGEQRQRRAFAYKQLRRRVEGPLLKTAA